MVRFLLVLSVLSSAFISAEVMAATATCRGKVRNMNLFFQASGSISRTRDGSGFVKINNRIVAQFEGDTANISYITQTFSIRNDRGDFVSGKLKNLSGSATLTSLVLPGEGIRLSNVPVRCQVN